MKKIYTFTTNKTANVSDFSLLLLDYLSRDDEDAKTFDTEIEDEGGRTVMEIDAGMDTILFDRRLLQDIMKDIMNDVAALARASASHIDEDESNKEDDEDDDEDEDDDDDGWEIYDNEDDDEEDEDEDIDCLSVTTKDGRIFRVGDRVRAVRGSRAYNYAAGASGRILAVDRTDIIFPLYVRFEEGGCTLWMDETNLTFLSE